jgi:hypothetical protein
MIGGSGIVHFVFLFARSFFSARDGKGGTLLKGYRCWISMVYFLLLYPALVLFIYMYRGVSVKCVCVCVCVCERGLYFKRVLYL